MEAFAYMHGRWMPRCRCRVHHAGISPGVAAPASTSSASALLPEESAILRCSALGNVLTI